MADVKIPPQNLDAEKAVLGALLTSEGVYENVSTIIKTEDFYLDAHRVIYEALQRIIHANKRADIILLVEELDREKKLEAVGGIAYLNALAGDSVATVYNVEEHARIVSEKSQLRRLIDVGNKIVGMSYAGEDNASDIVNEAEQMVLGVSGQVKADTAFTPMGQVVMSTMEHIHNVQQNQGMLTGLSTGFRYLDQVTNGLQRSDLILVAARPSMGKTAFTLNVAQNVAIRGKKTVAFFSLEMSKEQLVARILSSVAEVTSDKLRRGDLNGEEWSRVIQAADRMSNASLFIDDTPGLTPQEMRSKLRRLKVEQGLDLVVVDYIQLMQGRANSTGRSSENRQQEISEISRNLKLIARELDVPVIALSQLSRGVESRPDKRPLLSDLRESGSLEQDADIVAFLYRDKYYNEDTELGDITELLIRKHRNGALTTVQLVFQGEFTRFRDAALNMTEE